MKHQNKKPTCCHLPSVHQAIEGFALMVKKTAQMLQSFGTELAETELPNEIQATATLMSTHTDKKNKMKVNEVHEALLLILCGSFFFCCCSFADDFLYVCVQEDLLVALGQGGRLLESINEPIAKNPDHNMNQDEMENLATVQRSEQGRGIKSV